MRNVVFLQVKLFLELYKVECDKVVRLFCEELKIKERYKGLREENENISNNIYQQNCEAERILSL